MSVQTPLPLVCITRESLDHDAQDDYYHLVSQPQFPYFPSLLPEPQKPWTRASDDFSDTGLL